MLYTWPKYLIYPEHARVMLIYFRYFRYFYGISNSNDFNRFYCHNLLGYIAACIFGCRRGVYYNRKHVFLTAVIDRRDRNSIN
jgi:hypothetical protein